MKMQKSRAAQAAQQIRSQLKTTGLKCRVTCENYSGGNSVRVEIYDAKPEVCKLVNMLVDKYVYGRFDGMTDCYEYTSRNDDLPQVKYGFVENELSDELRQEIYDHVRHHWVSGDQLPASYKDGCNIPFHNAWVSDFVWRLFREENSTFWRQKSYSVKAA